MFIEVNEQDVVSNNGLNRCPGCFSEDIDCIRIDNPCTETDSHLYHVHCFHCGYTWGTSEDEESARNTWNFNAKFLLEADLHLPKLYCVEDIHQLFFGMGGEKEDIADVDVHIVQKKIWKRELDSMQEMLDKVRSELMANSIWKEESLDFFIRTIEGIKDLTEKLQNESKETYDHYYGDSEEVSS